MSVLSCQLAGVQKVASMEEMSGVPGEETMSSLSVRGAEVSANIYACSAVHGFFRSIALSVENSLQDTLR